MTALEGTRSCRVALRQTFLQDGEKETARFLGRGEFSVENGEARLFCRFREGERLPPQVLRFPLGDRTAVTLESESGRLRFPGEAPGKTQKEMPGKVPEEFQKENPEKIPGENPAEGTRSDDRSKERCAVLSLSTPVGTLSFLFHPLSAENSIDPDTCRGSVTLRYRLTDGCGFLRETELTYTLF